MMKICSKCKNRLYPMMTGSCPKIWFAGLNGLKNRRMACEGAGIYTINISMVELRKLYPSDEDWKKAFIEHINEIAIPTKEHERIWPTDKSSE